jgi:hypothetical protein
MLINDVSEQYAEQLPDKLQEPSFSHKDGKSEEPFQNVVCLAKSKIAPFTEWYQIMSSRSIFWANKSNDGLTTFIPLTKLNALKAYTAWQHYMISSCENEDELEEATSIIAIMEEYFRDCYMPIGTSDNRCIDEVVFMDNITFNKVSK